MAAAVAAPTFPIDVVLMRAGPPAAATETEAVLMVSLVELMPMF